MSQNDPGGLPLRQQRPPPSLLSLRIGALIWKSESETVAMESRTTVSFKKESMIQRDQKWQLWIKSYKGLRHGKQVDKWLWGRCFWPAVQLRSEAWEVEWELEWFGRVRPQDGVILRVRVGNEDPVSRRKVGSVISLQKSVCQIDQFVEKHSNTLNLQECQGQVPNFRNQILDILDLTIWYGQISSA